MRPWSDAALETQRGHQYDCDLEIAAPEVICFDCAHHPPVCAHVCTDVAGLWKLNRDFDILSGNIPICMASYESQSAAGGIVQGCRFS